MDSLGQEMNFGDLNTVLLINLKSLKMCILLKMICNYFDNPFENRS